MRSNHRFLRINFVGISAALAIGCALSLLAADGRAVMVGATHYANQLTGATVTSFGRVGNPGVVFTNNGDMALALDGGVGGYGQSNANKFTDYSNNGPTFFQWARPSGTFTARTFITQQGASYPFVLPGPYQLSINSGGGGTFVDIAGHNEAGVGGTSPFVVTSLPELVTGSAAQILFSSLNRDGSNGFAVMQEVIAIEDQLERLTISSASASSTLGGYFVDDAFDNEAHLAWASAVSAPGQTLTLNLAEPGKVGALWITGVDTRDEEFDIYFNGSLTPAVTGVEWDGIDNSAFIKLDTPASNVSSITLSFTNAPNGGSAVHYIGEVIPFAIVAPVPEPSSACLVGLGAALWFTVRRGRRGRVAVR